MVRGNHKRANSLTHLVCLFRFIPFRLEKKNHNWGAKTIQGIMAYYYKEVKPAESVELNRCRFNQIAENPRRSSFDGRGLYPRGTPVNSTTATYHDQEWTVQL